MNDNSLLVALLFLCGVIAVAWVHAQHMQSLIDAFKFADRKGYDWVITMDCDEQHEPEMIPKFIEQIETDRWDIISGSRYLAPRDSDDLPPEELKDDEPTLLQ